MPEFKIQHLTKYTYESPVRDSANQIILYPIKDEFQDVLKHEIKITGEPQVDIHIDYYGNEVGSFTHTEPHTLLEICSKIMVNTRHPPIPHGRYVCRPAMARPVETAQPGTLHRFFEAGILCGT